eukprot:symbB.v1.2.033977.t1/scaffold4304.1/size41633/2
MEDYQLAGSSIYCEPVEYGPCRLVYNLPYLHAEIRTRNITMNDVSAASIPFFAVPPLTIEDSKGPTIRLVVGKEGTLSVLAMGASLVIRLWATLLLVQAAAMIGEVRHLEEGPVQGTCSGTVCEFLGLPYAAAPVHDLRWRPPQAMTPWKTLRSARAFGNNCLQAWRPPKPERSRERASSEMKTASS